MERDQGERPGQPQTQRDIQIINASTAVLSFLAAIFGYLRRYWSPGGLPQTNPQASWSGWGRGELELGVGVGQRGTGIGGSGLGGRIKAALKGAWSRGIKG